MNKGSKVESEFFINMDKNNVEDVICVFKKIYEENKREIEYYKELESEFNTIIESSSDGIHVTDGEGTTLRFNRACERIEDISRKEMIGKNMRDMVKAGIYSKSVTVEVLESKRSVTLLQHVNGKEVMATGTPVFKDGRINRVVINSRDITELNKLKRELNDAYTMKEKAERELEFLRQRETSERNVVAESISMKRIIKLAESVAKVDSTVLIQGESGVGKGVISSFIHKNSNRRKGPFIKIDCSAIPENLLESELFGYEKGAFTGANNRGKIGLIELANKGTLFLDEIGEMPLGLQAKLLRFIQDREFIRVGGKNPISVDIRVIAATNRSLRKMIDEKNFRQDLYYRLNVIPISIPPLRERKEDIRPLINSALNKLNKKYNFTKRFNVDTLEMLVKYTWPGNVRELENITERLIVTTSFEEIMPEDLPSTIGESVQNKRCFNMDNIKSYKDSMDKFERSLLMEIKKKSNSTIEMAEILKIDPSTVRRKLKKHHIKIDFE
ncbi:sigma-54 interaction domain-containing protein [Anaeromicrobium sediminis]|uniref:sigma-54 interaction domain-containing protein n=1 Tax=Anaeromicrobium sediminis TaxID=1478221 RepID=UPI00159621F6|nr:sigma 54-interacting transcriptional regulator [Anaeromicrobium sediminis]